MSAEVLREAAALMRERAQNVALTDWYFTQAHEESFRGYDVWTHDGETHWTVATSDYADTAEHIASWHPAVALAVADWLERTADDEGQWYGARAACRDLDQNGPDADGMECGCAYKDCYEHGKWHNCTHGAPDLSAALAVARAYLGEVTR
jgi:hypothetical protein